MTRRTKNREVLVSKRNLLITLIVIGVVSILFGLITAQGKNSDQEGLKSTRPRIIDESFARLKPRALFVGDSWINGSDIGGRGEANWSRIVAAHYSWEYKSLAVASSGYVVGGPAGNRFGSSSRIGRIRGFQPDVLIFANGINDLLGVPEEQLETRLNEIRLRSAELFTDLRRQLPETTFLVIGYIPPGEATPQIKRANSLLSETAMRDRIKFIDPSGPAGNWFGGENRSMIGRDQYHATDVGNTYLARIIIERLDVLSARRWPQVYDSNLVVPPQQPKTNPYAN